MNMERMNLDNFVKVNNAGAAGKPGISEDRYNVENLEYIFGVNFRRS